MKSRHYIINESAWFFKAVTLCVATRSYCLPYLMCIVSDENMYMWGNFVCVREREDASQRFYLMLWLKGCMRMN